MLFQNHSKLSQMIIVLVGLSSFPTAVHSDPLAIIDSLIDFKEDLFAGKVGDKGAFHVCSGLFSNSNYLQQMSLQIWQKPY